MRKTYHPCCGKVICDGCSLAEDDEIKKGNIKPWCALCRVPNCGRKEALTKRYKRRMELNDAEAFYTLGGVYTTGDFGLSKNIDKALELTNRAAELGSCNAHYNLANAYWKGDGVKRDTEKSTHHMKLAAIKGHELARHALGIMEQHNGNVDNAMKHFTIVARAGDNESLKAVGEGYKAGHVTKDDYAKTLRVYQHSINEMKSKQRDIAASLDGGWSA